MMNKRLYQDLAHRIVAEIASGKYAVGNRLPAERLLAEMYSVSRPTVREAVIALEVQGLVDVRLGSGAYVLGMPTKDANPGFHVTAFELSEARLLIEGEAAALAATQATQQEIVELAALIEKIAHENQNPQGTEKADRAFHLAIAKATHNNAIFSAIEHLWHLRANSAESSLLHAKARSANIKPVVAEHAAVLDAVRRRDAVAARLAMRTHLSAVLDSLLFATEEMAIEEARRVVAAKRARYRPVKA